MQPASVAGSPGKSSPSPPFTKSYSIPLHFPGSPGTGRGFGFALSYWNPFQSGDLKPFELQGATAETPEPNRRDSTRKRPWNAGSCLAYAFTYHRLMLVRYPFGGVGGGDSPPTKYR